jgi:hypothetical protein
MCCSDFEFISLNQTSSTGRCRGGNCDNTYLSIVSVETFIQFKATHMLMAYTVLTVILTVVCVL